MCLSRVIKCRVLWHWHTKYMEESSYRKGDSFCSTKVIAPFLYNSKVYYCLYRNHEQNKSSTDLPIFLSRRINFNVIFFPPPCLSSLFRSDYPTETLYIFCCLACALHYAPFSFFFLRWSYGTDMVMAWTGSFKTVRQFAPSYCHSCALRNKSCLSSSPCCQTSQVCVLPSYLTSVSRLHTDIQVKLKLSLCLIKHCDIDFWLGCRNVSCHLWGARLSQVFL